MPTFADFIAGWPLFRDPILVGMGAGAALGLLGVFIVLRRMVFISAALSQAAGLGVALSFFGQIHLGLSEAWASPRIGALLTTLATAVVLRRESRHLSQEGLLGFIYLAAMALTLMVGTRITQEAHDIQAILFGTGVMVRDADVWWVLVAAAVVLVLVFWWRRGLLFVSLNPDEARVRRLPVGLLQLVILGTVAVMVSIGTRALGALPVFAFSVLPALAAVMLVSGPTAALVLATVLGALAGGGGYLLAFFGQFPVGASQTVAAATLTFLALVVRQGLRLGQRHADSAERLNGGDVPAPGQR